MHKRLKKGLPHLTLGPFSVKLADVHLLNLQSFAALSSDAPTAMNELLTFAFSGAVLPFTVLLVLALVYWLLVLVGLLDLDLFDFDLDTDIDVDLDVDVDTDLDTDMDAGGTGGAWSNVLGFLNLGTVPFMIVYSVAVLWMWLGAMLGTYYMGATGTLLLGLTLIGVVLGSLMLTKLTTWPLKQLFQRLNAEEHIQIIGRECTIRARASFERFGQAEIATEGAPLIFTIKTTDEGTTVRSGDKALVIAKGDAGDYYLVDSMP